MTLIDACVREDPTQRPNADLIEEKLFHIDQLFWTFLKEREIKDYTMSMNNNQKNLLFEEFYNSLDSDLTTYENEPFNKYKIN